MRPQYTHTPTSTQDFYPTPPHLVARMLSAVDWRTVSTVLEPSAGKGDLADAIQRRIGSDARRQYHRATLDCIEIDPTLQHILRGKGHTIVHDDFLTFRTAQKYDLIVANFPFSVGEYHLLHAIDLLRPGGGQLVGLVNAETLRNPCTRSRRRLAVELRTFDADIVYLSDQFVVAERTTDVEVALVNVRIPADDRPSILLDSLRDADHDEPYDAAHREVVSADPIANMLARFDLECRAGVQLIAEYDGLAPLMLNRLSLAKGDEAEKYAKPIITLEVDGSPYGTDRVNAYVRATRHKYWHALIGNETFRAGYTSTILDALDGKLDDLRHKDFTAFNIRQLEAELRTELPGSIEDAILTLFDDLSRRYAFVEGSGNNVHYYTGWKTNRAHKINQKVILPLNGFGAYSHGKLDAYKIAERLADMVKVFQYLEGAPIDATRIASRAVEAANAADRYRNLDLHYFTATFYKKGTCHLRFTNQDLLDKFNIFGAQKRNWLPPSYGCRAYRDMDPDEQAVVDDFQGEAAYTHVMARRDYYLAAIATPQLGMGAAA